MSVHKMVIFCFFFVSVVNAVRGPPRAEKSDIKHVVKVGDSLKIKCPIHGYPPPIVSWEKDEDEISYAWSRYRATRKTLKIKKVGKEDMGTYVCTGINGFGKAETRIELVVINPEDFPSISETDINSLSEPVFSKDTIKTTKDITLDSGDSVSLLCSASSVPEPQVSWYKNNELFRDSGLGSTLAINKVSAKDSGVYTCVAQNMVGSASVKYRVRVRDGDQGESNHTARINVSQGGTALIDCQVHTETRPSVKWLKKLDIYDLDFEAINSPESRVISVGEEHYKIIGDDDNLKHVGEDQWLSQLIVRSARSEDRGMYICFVTSGGRGFNFKQSYLSVIENISDQVDEAFPLMAVVIVLALVLVVSIIATAIICRVCRRQRVSETSSDTSDSVGAGDGVHQQLLKPGQPPAPIVVTVNKLDTLLCEQSGLHNGRSSTPLVTTGHMAHGHVSHAMPTQLGDNISSVQPVYQMSRDRQYNNYFARNNSEKSVGR